MFIRERLPKDVPLTLTLSLFLSLLVICTIYGYQLFQVMKPLRFSKLENQQSYLGLQIASVLAGLYEQTSKYETTPYSTVGVSIETLQEINVIYDELTKVTQKDTIDVMEDFKDKTLEVD